MENLLTQKMRSLANSNSHFSLPPIGRSMARDISNSSIRKENISPLSNQHKKSIFFNQESI